MIARQGEMLMCPSLVQMFSHWPFVQIRWVESKKVENRTILIWSSIKELLNFWQKLTKSKQSKCKSYKILTETIKGPIIIEKLIFFLLLPVS